VARFRSNKRFKELQRKAKKEAKEERKKERQEGAATKGPDDDIDWSQAVGIDPPPGTVPEDAASDDDVDDVEQDVQDLDDDDDEADLEDDDEDSESRR
jgi:hypothetical protein